MWGSQAKAYEESSIQGICPDFGSFDHFLSNESVVQDWYHYLTIQFRCQPVTDYFLKLLSADEALKKKFRESRMNHDQIQAFYHSLEWLGEIDWRQGNWNPQTEGLIREEVDRINRVLKKISEGLSPLQFDYLREQVLIGIPSDFA